MSFLYSLLFTFTVICKPGYISTPDEINILLQGNMYDYYEYELNLPNGSYRYSSFTKDTIYFFVEDGFEYTSKQDSILGIEEFELKH